MNNIIITIICLVASFLGALVAYLIMRARYAVIVEKSKNSISEMDSLQMKLSERIEEISEQKSANQQLMVQNGELKKELELTQEKVAEKDHELRQRNTDCEELQKQIETQVHNYGQMQSKLESVQKELELTVKKVAEKNEIAIDKDKKIEQLTSKAEESFKEKSEIQLQRDTTQKELSLLKEQLENNNNLIAQLKQKEEKLQTEKTEILSQRDAAKKEIALLKEIKEKDEQERAEALKQQLQLAKEQLQNATQEILKQREESLNKTNSEQLSHVVNPLKEQLEAMQKQVADNLKASTENKISMEEALKTLMQRTQEIGNDANNLARALKNENKIQGNWGEIILEKLLESSGLEEGKHYDKQTTLRDSTGKPILHDETSKRLIPDIIIHYPDGKDCVIDSKVSLSAYLDYCNADTDEDRYAALSKHVASVRNHVKELFNKDYSSYIKPPRQSIDYTIMFIPNETAMQLALHEDRTLWRDAFEKGVCITSEQNLLVVLRMIQIAWTQVQQAQNQQEVFEQARKLLDRVSDFVERFDKVGEQIKKAQEGYNNAREKLYNGNQSIIKAAKDMEKLGAKTSPKRQLPEPSDWIPME